MNTTWPNLPLRQIASEMCLGKMLDKNKNQGVLQPYLRNVNVRWFTFDLSDMKDMRFEESESERFSLRDGDLVVCEGGEPGRAAVWSGQEGDAKIQKALHRIRFPKDVYDARFAMYFIYYGTITNAFAEHYTGTTIKHLTGKALSQVRFPVPPLLEQQRIVSKIEELFSGLDAGVAALKRAKAKLKRYRASVLKAAVEGRLTADWRSAHPDVEPASELLHRILTTRRKNSEFSQLAEYERKGKKPPAGWKDKYKEPSPPDTTQLLNLPAGWTWATAEQMGEVQLGRQRSPKNRSKDYPTKYIRAANITEAGIDISDVLDMEFTPVELERYRMQKGDLVLSEASGSPDQVGKPAVWNDEIPDCCFQNTVIRLRPDGVSSEYLLNVFRHCYFNKVFAQIAGGVGINHLSARKFSQIPIPLPPEMEQHEIVESIERSLSVVAKCEHQIAVNLLRASRLRQSILRRAFEGKLIIDNEPSPSCMKRRGG